MIIIKFLNIIFHLSPRKKISAYHIYFILFFIIIIMCININENIHDVNYWTKFGKICLPSHNIMLFYFFFRVEIKKKKKYTVWWARDMKYNMIYVSNIHEVYKNIYNKVKNYKFC